MFIFWANSTYCPTCLGIFLFIIVLAYHSDLRLLSLEVMGFEFVLEILKDLSFFYQYLKISLDYFDRDFRLVPISLDYQRTLLSFLMMLMISRIFCFYLIYFAAHHKFFSKLTEFDCFYLYLYFFKLSLCFDFRIITSIRYSLNLKVLFFCFIHLHYFDNC